MCKDIEFMLNISTGIYWRICWSIITPAFMTAILIYNLIVLEPIKYKDYIYPDNLYSKRIKFHNFFNSIFFSFLINS